MQLTPSVTSNVATVGSRTGPLLLQGRQGGDPAQFLVRGPLAARAHKLLGLGAAGSARLGQGTPSMIGAFGGDAATYHRLANPWVGARSLARPVESLPVQSSISWLLSSSR